MITKLFPLMRYLMSICSVTLFSSVSATESVSFFNRTEALNKQSSIEEAFHTPFRHARIHIASQSFEKKLRKRLHNHAQLSSRDQLKLSHTSHTESHRYRTYQQYHMGLPVLGAELTLVLDKQDRIIQSYGTLIKGLEETEFYPQQQVSTKDALSMVKRIVDPVSRYQIQLQSIQRAIFLNSENHPTFVFETILFMDTHEGQQDPKRLSIFFDPQSQSIVEQVEMLTHWQPPKISDDRPQLDTQIVSQSRRIAGGGPGGNEKQPHAGYPALEDALTTYPPKTFSVLENTLSGGKKQCLFSSDDVETRDARHLSSTDPLPEHPYTYDCTDSKENTYQSINGALSPLNDAHYRAQITSRMFHEYFGEKPLGKLPIIQYVHYGQQYNNAFWNGKYLAFGDGNAKSYPLVALDVVSHEIAHAFTEKSGQKHKRMARREAKAINEAFSDMAGEATEHFLYGSNDWQHNDESTRGDGALRYLDDPTRNGHGIKHIRDHFPRQSPYDAAGVFTHAFYQLATIDKPWNTKYAFIAFAKANQHCWQSRSSFIEAADCVMQQGEAVAHKMRQDGVKKPDGTPYPAFELKNHIRKAFQVVGIQLRLNDGVTATFQATPSFLQVQFVASATREGADIPEEQLSNWQIHWDFGDGTQLDGTLKPLYRYTQAGEYTVTMTLISPQGEEDQISLPISIQADYCQAIGKTAKRNWLSQVEINHVKYTSDIVPYSDRRAIPVHIKKGTHANLKIIGETDLGIARRQSKVYYLWLDFNRDGRFHPSLELVMRKVTDKDTIETSIDLAKFSGRSLSARFIVSPELIRKPCGQFSGEVEDYRLEMTDEAPLRILNIGRGASVLKP